MISIIKVHVLAQHFTDGTTNIDLTSKKHIYIVGITICPCADSNHKIFKIFLLFIISSKTFCNVQGEHSINLKVEIIQHHTRQSVYNVPLLSSHCLLNNLV